MGTQRRKAGKSQREHGEVGGKNRLEKRAFLEEGRRRATGGKKYWG